MREAQGCGSFCSDDSPHCGDCPDQGSDRKGRSPLGWAQKVHAFQIHGVVSAGAGLRVGGIDRHQPGHGPAQRRRGPGQRDGADPGRLRRHPLQRLADARERSFRRMAQGQSPRRRAHQARRAARPAQRHQALCRRADPARQTDGERRSRSGTQDSQGLSRDFRAGRRGHRRQQLDSARRPGRRAALHVAQAGVDRRGDEHADHSARRAGLRGRHAVRAPTRQRRIGSGGEDRCRCWCRPSKRKR